MTALYERAKALFRELCDLPPEERAVRLAAIGEPSLAEEVRALIAFDKSDTFPEPVPPEDVPLPTIPGYRVIRTIGAGGMGVVVEAEQERPRRRVALKLIGPGVLWPQVRRRFEQEIEMLGRLRHPGIAQIYGAGSTEPGPAGQPYYAMELIEGRPIHEYARARGLSTRERLALVAQVCDAVHHAHSAGVIHRDLKPDNILVQEAARNEDRTGSAELVQPKVLDFGVARATDADLRRVTLQTSVGQLVGTLPYMSPEQASGDLSRLDTRSDIYSLGVLCYELLAGRLPFELGGASLADMVRRIQEDDPVRLGSIDARFRGDIETIIEKSLAKAPADRYQSAAELAADLRRHLGDEPILARPRSALYQLRKFARRNRTLVGAVAGVAISLVIATAISVESARRARIGERTARFGEYRAAIGAGAAALAAEEPEIVREQLDAAPPEHRGWEWFHLDGAVDESELAIAFPAPLRAAQWDRGAREWVTLDAEGRLERWAGATGERTTAVAAIGPVRLAAFDREGSHLAMVRPRGDGSDAEVIEVREVRTGEVVDTLPPSPVRIAKLAVSPSGGEVVLADGWQMSGIWRRGDAELSIRRGSARLSEAEFTRDGSRYAGAYNELGEIGLFHVRDTEPPHGAVRTGHEYGRYWTIAYDPARERIAVGGDRKTISIYEGAPSKRVRHAEGHNSTLRALAYDDQGDRLASGSSDERVILWEGDGSRRITTFSGHTEPVTEVGFGDEGMVWATTESALRSWRAGTSATSEAIDRAPLYMYAALFTTDGRFLVTGGDRSALGVFDGRTGEPLARFDPYSGVERAFAIEGGRVVSIYGDRLQRIDLVTGVGDSQILARRSRHTPAGVDRSGRWFAGAKGAELCLWDLDERREVRVHPAEPARAGDSDATSAPPTRSVPWWGGAITADGRRYLGADASGRIVVFDRESGAILRTFHGEAGRTRAFALDPAETIVARGLESGAIELWDLRSGELRGRLVGHRSFVHDLAFSADGTRLASGSDDTTIRIWHVERRVILLVLDGHAEYVHDVCFSPDGARLVSASGDHTVRWWDSRSRSQRGADRLARAHRRESLRGAVEARLSAGEAPAALLAELERTHADPIDRELVHQIIVRFTAERR